MKKIKLIVLFLLIICFGYSQPNNNKKLDSNEKLYGLSEIWKEVHYNYPYLSSSNINWDSLYYSTIPKVIKAKSTADYYNELRKFICFLHEGHTDIVYTKRNNKIGVIDIAVNYIEDRFYVVGIGNDLMDSVAIGDEIVSISGMSVKAYIDSSFYPVHNFSKRIVYSYAAFQLLAGDLSQMLNIKLQKSNGTTYKLKLRRKPRYGKWAVYKSIVPRKSFLYKRYGDVSYIRIGSFSNRKAIDGFIAHIDSLKGSNSIIIDVRKNFGGTSYGNEICKYFINDTVFQEAVRVTKINNSFYKAQGCFLDSNVRKLIRTNRNPKPYEKYRNYYYNSMFDTTYFYTNNNDSRIAGLLSDKKLVVLVDQYSASATETFLLTLRYNKIGLFIGTDTYGSTGQPLIVPLSGNAYAKIASSLTLNPDGSIFNYIKPDLYVTPTIEDYINGNDRILNKAFEYLKN